MRSDVPNVDSRFARRLASNRNGSSSSSAFDLPLPFGPAQQQPAGVEFEDLVVVTPDVEDASPLWCPAGAGGLVRGGAPGQGGDGHGWGPSGSEMLVTAYRAATGRADTMGPLAADQPERPRTDSAASRSRRDPSSPW